MIDPEELKSLGFSLDSSLPSLWAMQLLVCPSLPRPGLSHQQITTIKSPVRFSSWPSGWPQNAVFVVTNEEMRGP